MTLKSKIIADYNLFTVPQTDPNAHDHMAKDHYTHLEHNSVKGFGVAPPCCFTALNLNNVQFILLPETTGERNTFLVRTCGQI